MYQAYWHWIDQGQRVSMDTGPGLAERNEALADDWSKNMICRAAWTRDWWHYTQIHPEMNGQRRINGGRGKWPEGFGNRLRF